MKEKHIVLRSLVSPTRDLFAGPSAEALVLAPLATSVKVEVDQLDRSDLAKLTQDRSIVAVAPAMQVKLVAPVEFANVAPAPAVGPSWGIAAVGADRSAFTGRGVTVAVLDTGIDATHPAFAGVDIKPRDFTGTGDGDGHGHGTHCAGTIFGRDVEGCRIGVARGVTRALIGKVLDAKGGGSSESIALALQWAAQSGAHVVSMSLGIDFPGHVASLVDQGLPVATATSRALEAYRANVMLFERLMAFVRAQSGFGHTTIAVAAAGNESDRARGSDFEIAVSPPAVSEGFISVGALDRSPRGLVIANFSNVGANLSAPGVGIVSARSGGGLVAMSGTSMATPHVAGVAALWVEKLREDGILNPTMLAAKLLASGTTTVLAPGFDPAEVGAGTVMAP